MQYIAVAGHPCLHGKQALRAECIGAPAILKATRQDDGSSSGHSAATIASSPSVSAAGPGCKIKADLISTIRSSRTAGISFQPQPLLILSGTTFLPPHAPRITTPTPPPPTPPPITH